jgi:hypothetical protein
MCMFDSKNKSNGVTSELWVILTSAYGTGDCKSRFLPTMFC